MVLYQQQPRYVLLMVFAQLRIHVIARQDIMEHVVKRTDVLVHCSIQVWYVLAQVLVSVQTDVLVIHVLLVQHASLIFVNKDPLLYHHLLHLRCSTTLTELMS
jgi:hypothetical protein